MASDKAIEFESIYSKYYGPVRTFISKLGGHEWTDDLTQETFVRVQENLNGLRNKSNPAPWVFKIARNLYLDHYRSRAAKSCMRKPADEGDHVELIALLKMEQHEMSCCMQEKVDQLAEPLRSVLVLSEIDGLSRREIGETLGISPGNVKVRLHRARKALKEILERDCTFEFDSRCVMVCLPRPLRQRKGQPELSRQTHPCNLSPSPPVHIIMQRAGEHERLNGHVDSPKQGL
jgi:RNA polymerase sigma-70 factor (ECF subfamily)